MPDLLMVVMKYLVSLFLNILRLMLILGIMISEINRIALPTDYLQELVFPMETHNHYLLKKCIFLVEQIVSEHGMSVALAPVIIQGKFILVFPIKQVI